MEEIENNIQYFAEREERAVIDYIVTNSQDEKNRIYNEILIEPFRKMIQSILRRYPIHIGNYDMGEIEQNALTHLVDHMIKYKPFIIERKSEDILVEKWIKLPEQYRFIHYKDAKNKLDELINSGDNRKYRLFNSKAFSYCQTIIRNYYKDHGRKSYTEKKTNLNFDEHIDEINQNNNYIYEIEDNEHHRFERLINDVIEKIENVIDNDNLIKKNECLVGDAIINILRNWEILFMEDTPDGKYNKRVTNKFAKNKILLFLKEQTGLNTKEIRIAIKPFKEIYFFEKMNYLND